MYELLKYNERHTEVITFPGLYLDGAVFINHARFTYLTHVTVGDVLAINLHAVDMLPHTVTHSSTPLSTYQCKQ